MRGGLRALQARILARAQTVPDAGAVSLVLAGQVCGSMAPGIARILAREAPGLRLRDAALTLEDDGLDCAQRSGLLLGAAQLLRQKGLTGPWRQEALEVRAQPQGPALARIDRSAVRVLGITTYSVHLNAYTDGGLLAIAQRAAHKRVDPGLWDNLAGGMIAAGEDPQTALAREAYEEAGIRLEEMTVRTGARIRVRRPIAEGTLAEVVHVYDVELPPQTRLENRDGEVARFDTRTVPDVCAALERGEFTVEAALATVDSLLRRGFE